MSKGKKLETFNTSFKNYKDNQGKLSKVEYLNLMNGFAEFLMDCILEGETVYIPEKLGAIQIVGRKLQTKVTDNGIEGLTVNWGATKKLWRECESCKEKEQKVYHFNEHSDGLRYRFFWSRTAMILANKVYYTYLPNRKSKHKLFKKIVEEQKEYLIVEGRYAPRIKFQSKNKKI